MMVEMTPPADSSSGQVSYHDYYDTDTGLPLPPHIETAMEQEADMEEASTRGGERRFLQFAPDDEITRMVQNKNGKTNKHKTNSKTSSCLSKIGKLCIVLLLVVVITAVYMVYDGDSDDLFLYPQGGGDDGDDDDENNNSKHDGDEGTKQDISSELGQLVAGETSHSTVTIVGSSNTVNQKLPLNNNQNNNNNDNDNDKNKYTGQSAPAEKEQQQQQQRPEEEMEYKGEIFTLQEIDEMRRQLLPPKELYVITPTPTPPTMVDSGTTTKPTTTTMTMMALAPSNPGVSPRTAIPNEYQLAPHQFLFLHHMKTGGSSLDSLIRCGMRRLQMQPFGYQVPYGSIHECNPYNYAQCLSGSDHPCQTRMSQSSLLSFCAPLRDLPTFQWEVTSDYHTTTNNNDDEDENHHHYHHHSRQLSPSSSSSQYSTIATSTTPMSSSNNELHSQHHHHHNSSKNETKQSSTTATTTKPASSTSTGGPPIHAVTVLRHPVDRVWSMYRFKTKYCYGCLPLKTVYEIIANGTEHLHFGQSTSMILGGGRGKTTTNPVAQTCASQLQNHMTRNLLLQQQPRQQQQQQQEDNPQQEEIDYDQLLLLHGNRDGKFSEDWVEEQRDQLLQQAIQDVTSFFTIVGLTDDLEATREMVGQVFPWLAEHVEGSNTTCTLPHANASPQNNHCGKDGRSHWDLPPHPSSEEAQLIEQYNALDIQLYHAAERLHKLQKVALNL